MQVIKTIAEIKTLCRSLSRAGSLGFVPTMGFLHEGHLSLVDASIKDNSNTVVSVFVNPSQFGENEDLNTYPRDLDRDLDLLEKRGVKYVFYPQTIDMYPPDFLTWVNVEKLSEMHCGFSRPGHFRGVCTIVLKLINIVMPDYMYMGIKDFQQLTILRRMIKDLDLDTRIVSCPIVREPDGLAMSSRNTYLDEDARQRALCLSKAIARGQKLYDDGERNAGRILADTSFQIEKEGGLIDYLECIDPNTLKPVNTVQADTRMLIAVFIGRTRLIDNAPMDKTLL